MEQTPPSREQQIDAVFMRTRRWMRRLEVKGKFSKQESFDFERDLYLWFHRFARRPSNEYRPAEAFRWGLIRMAYRATREFKKAAPRGGKTDA